MRHITIFILLTALLWGQDITVTGKVTNGNTGSTIENVLVYSVNFQRSTHTGRDGSFELVLPRFENTSLKFFLAGFSPLTMEINSGNKATLQLDVPLDPVAIHLGEVTVTSPRYVSSLQESPFPLGIIEAQDINGLSKLSLAEYIKGEPGIAVTRDGIWATDISLRGIRGTGIVLMVDGNRLETATELSARMSMIDQFDIERIEVIKGAASSMYGTGALGGVVNIITQNRRFRDKFYITGSLGGFFNSVNTGSGTSLSLNTGDRNWFAKVRGSFRGASSTETPDGTLLNSHFHDNSISAAIGFKPFANHEFEVNYQRYGGDDIGLPGGSAFAAAAIARYPVVKREMISAGYQISGISPFLSNVSVKYYHQLIVRDAEVLLPTARLHPYADHFNDGIQLTSNWIIANNYRLVFGLDAWQREMDSKRERILNAKKDSIINERPVPLSKFRSGGIFFQNEIDNLVENLNIVLGGRLDLINIKSEDSYNPDFVTYKGTVIPNPPGRRLLWAARDENNTSWSLNLAALYKLGKGHQVAFNIGRSFRSPSLEERFQYLDLGSLVKLGDPALKPEQGLSLDLSYRYWSNRASFKAGFYLNSLTDLVVEAPGYTFQNRPATQMVNVGEARIFGFDLSFEYQVFKELIVYGNTALVRGEDTKKTEDLPFMPADNGTLGVKVSVMPSVDVSAEVVGVMDQKKLAPSEKPTAGYGLVNLAVHLKPFALPYGEISITAGVDNLMNRLYYNNLATNRGLIKAEPGRNVYLKAQYGF